MGPLLGRGLDKDHSEPAAVHEERTYWQPLGSRHVNPARTWRNDHG
jgi:hypothetical protein